MFIFRNQGSSVGIAAGYRLLGQGLIPGRDKRFFSSPQHPYQLWGPPHFFIQWVQRLFPWELSGQGVEADHSSPSSAEVKNSGVVPPLPCVFMLQCLIN
jgi:hypothetical protein